MNFIAIRQLLLVLKAEGMHTISTLPSNQVNTTTNSGYQHEIL
jgi:hypothetical protein